MILFQGAHQTPVPCSLEEYRAPGAQPQDIFAESQQPGEVWRQCLVTAIFEGHADVPGAIEIAEAELQLKLEHDIADLDNWCAQCHDQYSTDAVLQLKMRPPAQTCTPLCCIQTGAFVLGDASDSADHTHPTGLSGN